MQRASIACNNIDVNAMAGPWAANTLSWPYKCRHV